MVSGYNQFLLLPIRDERTTINHWVYSSGRCRDDAVGIAYIGNATKDVKSKRHTNTELRYNEYI